MGRFCVKIWVKYADTQLIIDSSVIEINLLRDF